MFAIQLYFIGYYIEKNENILCFLAAGRLRESSEKTSQKKQ